MKLAGDAYNRLCDHALAEPDPAKNRQP